MQKVLVTLILLSQMGIHAGVYQQSIQDYKVDHTQGHVLEIAKTLPMTGVLKKKPNGYVYLDISNEYITKIFPQLILDGHLRPTTSFASEEGAHISVITDQELPSEGLDAEIGKEFRFEITEMRFVESWKDRGFWGKSHTGNRWMIAVESPQLEELRMRYGLSALSQGHDFHISIGFEVPFERINNFGERPPQ